MNSIINITLYYAEAKLKCSCEMVNKMQFDTEIWGPLQSNGGTNGRSWIVHFPTRQLQKASIYSNAPGPLHGRLELKAANSPTFLFACCQMACGGTRSWHETFFFFFGWKLTPDGAGSKKKGNEVADCPLSGMNETLMTFFFSSSARVCAGGSLGCRIKGESRAKSWNL